MENCDTFFRGESDELNQKLPRIWNVTSEKFDAIYHELLRKKYHYHIKIAGKVFIETKTERGHQKSYKLHFRICLLQLFESFEIKFGK